MNSDHDVGNGNDSFSDHQNLSFLLAVSAMAFISAVHRLRIA